MSEKDLQNQNCEKCELAHKDADASQNAVKVRVCKVSPECDIEEAKEDFVVRMICRGSILQPSMSSLTKISSRSKQMPRLMA